MNKIELSEASEDEFIDVVRAAIRSNGRSRFIEVMVDEEDGDDIVANENNDFLNSASNMSDDSDDESENDDGGSDAEDDNDSIESAENHGDKVQLHDRIIHDHTHCPPFPDMSSTFRGALCGTCDCEDFSLAFCLQENNFEFLVNCAYPIRFDELYLLAVEGIDNLHRRPNNEIRKYYYKKLFIALDFGALEKGERRKLPNCGVAKIRQLHPSESGYYMGFKEN